MAYKRIYLLPVILFILLPVSVLITYTIAVLKGHVEPGFPYISDTGSLSPESCIFAQFLNIAAFIMTACVYVRYLEVKNYTTMIPQGRRINPSINKVALTIGILSCIGLDIVANFQESNVFVVHMFGALLCFASGTLYFIFQTWISYQMPYVASKSLLLTRAVLVAVCILTTILTMLLGPLAFRDYQGSTTNTKKWKPEDGGWGLHIASTISEWVLCITFSILILSFVPEFYDLELEDPIITFTRRDSLQKNTLS